MSASVLQIHYSYKQRAGKPVQLTLDPFSESDKDRGSVRAGLGISMVKHLLTEHCMAVFPVRLGLLCKECLNTF